MSPWSHYPTDMTDEQWQFLAPLLPKPKWRPGGPGRQPSELRRVLNGIFYITKSGCQWRLLPRNFGHFGPGKALGNKIQPFPFSVCECPYVRQVRNSLKDGLVSRLPFPASASNCMLLLSALSLGFSLARLGDFTGDGVDGTLPGGMSPPGSAAAVTSTALGGGAVAAMSAQRRAKIGRNDPCWCGSGKKYKKCHGV